MLSVIQGSKESVSIDCLLASCGISLEEGQSEISVDEASAVIGHLTDIISEQRALLSSVVNTGMDNMSPQEQALWEGTAEAVIEMSEDLSDSSDIEESQSAEVVFIDSVERKNETRRGSVAEVIEFSNFQ